MLHPKYEFSRLQKNLKYCRNYINVKISKEHRAQRYEGAEGVEVKLQASLRSILEVQFSSRGVQRGPGKTSK